MKDLALLLFAGFSLIACAKEETPEAIMKKWTGRIITFPDSTNYVYAYRKDTVNSNVGDKPYRVLVYMDSTGCASCKLQANIWKKYIAETGHNADFLFWYAGKNLESLLTNLRVQRFKYPVYVDLKDRLNKLNKFPVNPVFQCFLLNRSNEVILTGSPVYNPRIWEWYKQVINSE
jgi:hypothetical protein